MSKIRSSPYQLGLTFFSTCKTAPRTLAFFDFGKLAKKVFLLLAAFPPHLSTGNSPDSMIDVHFSF